MITRTHDVDVVTKAMSQYTKPIKGFYPDEWLEDTSNLAFVNDNEDVALFEFNYPGVYTGHYFFFSRGKAAIEYSKEVLDLVFSLYGVEVIRGIVPLSNLGSRWITKKLGFKSYGIVHTPNGPEELFVLTKEEWENK